MTPCAFADLALDLRAEAASVTAARHAVVEWAGGFGTPTTDIALATSEAVSNAVVHAFTGREPGRIGIRGNRRGDRLIVTVTDDGIGMTPNLNSQGLGMGISLISKLAGDVRFDSTTCGTTVSMSFGVASGSGEA